MRNLEESHHFWTEILGFKQVGELKATPTRPNPAKMRFYSGDHDGHMNHHDVALIENTDLPAPPAEWSMNGMPMAIAHIAITLPNREAWLQQLEYLQGRGVKFNRRVEHGMTHSLYINDPNGYGIELLYELPREVWEGDIDAALNFAVAVPTEGAEALSDLSLTCRFFVPPKPRPSEDHFMAKRQSINGPVARHENPIPNASRIGNIVMSSVIGGTNPGTRTAARARAAGGQRLCRHPWRHRGRRGHGR